MRRLPASTSPPPPRPGTPPVGGTLTGWLLPLLEEETIKTVVGERGSSILGYAYSLFGFMISLLLTGVVPGEGSSPTFRIAGKRFFFTFPMKNFRILKQLSFCTKLLHLWRDFSYFHTVLPKNLNKEIYLNHGKKSSKPWQNLYTVLIIETHYNFSEGQKQ